MFIAYCILYLYFLPPELVFNMKLLLECIIKTVFLAVYIFLNIEFCPVQVTVWKMFKTSVQSLNKKYKNASISEMILEVYEINLGEYS